MAWKRVALAATMTWALASAASAQAPAAPAAVPAPVAAPADVASTDAIVKALYAVISGDAGVARDWDRFRSLFHPSARMIASGKAADGSIRVRVLTPEEYVRRSGPLLLRDGFHEREIARRVESYGQIAHVFSTYDAKHKVNDAAPFMRGINSIQLLNDGKRWWVTSIAWSSEGPADPLPARYLPSAK